MIANTIFPSEQLSAIGRIEDRSNLGGIGAAGSPPSAGLSAAVSVVTGLGLCPAPKPNGSYCSFSDFPRPRQHPAIANAANTMIHRPDSNIAVSWVGTIHETRAG